jgi:Ca-activated chloride channel family protein
MSLPMDSRWEPARGLATLLAVVMFAAFVPASRGQSQPAATYQISVDVDLVVLPVMVHDRQGRNIPDLGESDFKIYEERVPQAIRMFRHEDVPVVAGLLVDHSGSMRPKIVEVIAGARAFVQSSNAQDRMFVVNFNERVSLGLPNATEFTAEADQLERAIWRDPAAGETALYDAIVKALAKLQTGGLDKKVLVVISDGADNASSHSLAQALEMAERSSAIIYTVGLFAPDDRDANPKVLRRLARETGGEAFFPGQPSAVTEICKQIAREIRNQYTLGYVSTNAKRDGAYRAIRVSAQAPGRGKLFARTRSGYIRGAQIAEPKDEDEK